LIGRAPRQGQERDPDGQQGKCSISELRGCGTLVSESNKQRRASDVLKKFSKQTSEHACALEARSASLLVEGENTGMSKPPIETTSSLLPGEVVYESRGRNEWHHLYSAPTYRNQRRVFLLNNPLCCMCKRPRPAEVLDHIIPHKGNERLFWDERNWQPLCKHCHDSVKAVQEASIYTRKGLDGYPIE
jgi:HNH endonuclease